MPSDANQAAFGIIDDDDLSLKTLAKAPVLCMSVESAMEQYIESKY